MNRHPSGLVFVFAVWLDVIYIYIVFIAPRAKPILCLDRAVQAGKGPAPRYKGAPVGAQRDAAVRQLREVLVTYAILTIQNPDMWGDDVSSWRGCVVAVVVVVGCCCCCCS